MILNGLSEYQLEQILTYSLSKKQFKLRYSKKQLRIVLGCQWGVDETDIWLNENYHWLLKTIDYLNNNMIKLNLY
jgi:hypothetical protein